MPSLIVARAAVDDAILTRDNLRGVAAATYTASLTPDGTIERTTLSAVQQALFRRESEALERLASSADVRYPGTPGALQPAPAVWRPRAGSPCGATTPAGCRRPASPGSPRSASWIC